jgi:hypothetical protein
MGCGLVIAGGLVAGCSGGRTPQAFNTPEECFQFAQQAANQKDYVAAVDCMTEDTQETMAGVMVTAGTMTKAVAGMAAAFGDASEDAEKVQASLEKIDAVLEKHGVTDQTLEEAAQAGGLGGAFADAAGGAEQDPEQAMEGIRAMAAPVKDPRTFIADMITAMDGLGDNAGENPVQGFAGELTNVQIKGDQATATVKKSDGQENPIGFKKTNRGWRIHLDPQMLRAQPTSTQTTL